MPTSMLVRVALRERVRMWLGKRRRGVHVCEDSGFVHVLSHTQEIGQVTAGRNGRKHILVDMERADAER
jgi:hypothetical protein